MLQLTQMSLKSIKARLKSASILAVIFILLFGVIFTLLVPPLWGLDEPSHFYRVYQLAHGDLLPQRAENNFGGDVPKNLYELGNYAIGDLVDNTNTASVVARRDIRDKNGYDKYKFAHFSSIEQPSSRAAAYSVVAYPGPVFGVIIADALNANIYQTLIVARMMSVIVYAAIIGVSIWLVRNMRTRWLLFLVALLPTSIFQAAVVSADSVAIALSVLFTAAFVRINNAKEDDKRLKILLAILIIVGLLLPLVKLNYIFISFGLLLIPSRIFPRKRLVEWVKIITVILACIFALGWSLLSQVTANNQPSQRPDGAQVVASEQIAAVIHEPFHFAKILLRTTTTHADQYITQSTSLLGWNYVQLPLAVTFMLIVGILFSAQYARSEYESFKGRVLLFGCLAILSILSIFFTLYVAFTPATSLIVEGVQGRYFIPLIMPLAMAVAVLTPLSLNVKASSRLRLVVAIPLLSLGISLIYYYLATY